MIADYRAGSNPFGEWYSERCEPAPGEAAPAKELYDDYQAWCEAMNIDPMNQTAFGRALGDRQHIRQKSGGRAYRKGGAPAQGRSGEWWAGLCFTRPELPGRGRLVAADGLKDFQPCGAGQLGIVGDS